MLDINTRKGQISLIHETHMLQYISLKWKRKGIELVETLKDEACDCDGFLLKNNIITGLFESKCRDLTLEELKRHGSWLITFDKLEKCRELSEALKVPFFGFLYLIPAKKVLYWKIADKGEYTFKFDVSETRTQRTINGGSVVRANAYLPIEYSKIL